MEVANKYKSLRKSAKEYLRAREKFRSMTDNIPELNGNDNLVGRIGEFIAVQFIELTLKRKNVTRNTNAVQAGYDIVADNRRVSVKIITSENHTGRTTPIRDPWDELVLIELGERADVMKIGFLTRKEFEAAYKGSPSHPPIASRNMLKEDGLIGKYGKVYTGRAVKRYL